MKRFPPAPSSLDDLGPPPVGTNPFRVLYQRAQDAWAYLVPEIRWIADFECIANERLKLYLRGEDDPTVQKLLVRIDRKKELIRIVEDVQINFEAYWSIVSHRLYRVQLIDESAMMIRDARDCWHANLCYKGMLEDWQKMSRGRW